MNHLTDLQLNEYFDEALDATARREVDSHLQACAECRARLEELQRVFSDLTELHEIKMHHDLTSSIMARIPQKQTRIWTPFFAAQLGAALGVFIWLTTQVTNFITPAISTFHFPLSTIPTFQFTMPVFQLPNPNSLFTILHSLFTIPHSPFSIFNLPTFQLSNIPTFNLSTFNLILISTSIFILWLFGNLSLLRNNSGVRK